MTTLANRALFQDRMSRALAMSKRKKQEVGIVMLGLDRFKEVNQTLGREKGDALLKRTADRLRQCMREVDTVVRLGGDEFTILLEGINCKADKEIVAKRLLGLFAKPFELDAQQVTVTASLGITVYPLDPHEMDELLAHAEQAMDQAKEQGGNTYRFYEPIGA